MPGLLFGLLQIALTSHAVPPHTHAAAPSAAIANDNRVAAGRLVRGVLTLSLEAREALWYPEESASQPMSADTDRSLRGSRRTSARTRTNDPRACWNRDAHHRS